MIHGSCLCGSVKYEINGNFESISKCGCSECRKITGSDFSANALIRGDDFHLIKGEDNVAVYKVSDEVSRTFCSRCGSNLQYIINEHPEIIGVAMGTLDEDMLGVYDKLITTKTMQAHNN